MIFKLKEYMVVREFGDSKHLLSKINHTGGYYHSMWVLKLLIYVNQMKIMKPFKILATISAGYIY